MPDRGKHVWVALEDHRIVGGILAATRQRAGISQDQLALMLKKPQSFVSNFERGQRRLDVLEIIRIAGALGADPKRVFSEIVRRCATGESVKAK
jgi:transcriptional regulator with XRE-family HTH domain